MTSEQLHDALDLLPSDLISETDRRRSGQRPAPVRWKKWVSLAACFLLVFSSGLLYFRQLLPLKGSDSLAEECAPQAPAVLDTARQEPAQAAPAAPDNSLSTGAGQSPEVPMMEAHSDIRDLTEDVTAESAAVLDAFDGTAMTEFSVALFRNTARDGENTLLAPLSVMSSLAMTANGAQGQTLEQMEAALGIRVAELNSFLANFMHSQTRQLKPANSIWFNSSSALQPKQEFMEIMQGYFQADLYEAPMDPDTCQAINRWVSEKTDGNIPKILDEIPSGAMMYLVNALSFEARWPEVYEETSVHPGTFTQEDGTPQAVELMYSQESLYIEDDLATGFLKPYEDGRYAFVALLPREGVRVSDYVSSLSGKALQQLLRTPTETTVYAAIPKFDIQYGTELSQVLQSMGMTNAFDRDLADFSGMGTCAEGNLYISRILHRTRITVAEQGTTAGAATVVEILCGSAHVPDPREVTLDRPFVYMIVDRTENIPLFIGTLMEISG